MNKKDKEIVREAYSTVDGYREKLVDYCVSRTQSFVEIGDDILPIEKKDIITDFCFGYSDSPINTDSYDNAMRMVETAKTDEDYFLVKNMEEFRSYMDAISEQKLDAGEMPREVLAIMKRGRILDIRFVSAYDVINAFGGEVVVKDLIGKEFHLFGEDLRIPYRWELEVIRGAYEKAAEKHEKKVKAYIKRYGLKHVNAWEYWSDL